MAEERFDPKMRFQRATHAAIIKTKHLKTYLLAILGPTYYLKSISTYHKNDLHAITSRFGGHLLGAYTWQ